ncbi:hypothetical protein F444_13340 [Phytophthora nicotianae P1976]|uniref:Uncharacterized protein n=1 Tax=Phytophthora nicotianae P1976 TaxID=1317066 RepID=A0A080ZU41_PHYNI|nr:hypothetical protein F444_13340 [Phytophthora nicotianae P1976]
MSNFSVTMWFMTPTQEPEYYDPVTEHNIPIHVGS